MRPLDAPIEVVHVDDESTFAELAATFLEKQNPRFSVESVRSAESALAYLEEADPDCVVSDYEMPGESGISLLESVRGEYPDLPFILFTGKGSEEIASEAISKGVTDYLQKESGTEQYAVLANRIENAVAQHRAERELAATRERMTFALDATDSVVFEVDLETGENTHHGPFESLYGVPKAELSDTEEFDQQCVHPADRERINQYMDPGSFDELGDRVEFEFRTHPRNGEVRWIRSEAYIDTDADGTPQRLVGIDTDVTERRRRERELQLKDRAVEDAPVGISLVALDADGPRIVHANDRLLELVGYPRDAVVGATYRLFDGPETEETAIEERRRAFERAAPTTVEYLSHRQDGSTFRHRLSVAPLDAEAVADDRWVGIHRAVTDGRDDAG